MPSLCSRGRRSGPPDPPRTRRAVAMRPRRRLTDILVRHIATAPSGALPSRRPSCPNQPRRNAASRGRELGVSVHPLSVPDHGLGQRGAPPPGCEGHQHGQPMRSARRRSSRADNVASPASSGAGQDLTSQPVTACLSAAPMARSRPRSPRQRTDRTAPPGGGGNFVPVFIFSCSRIPGRRKPAAGLGGGGVSG